MIDVLADTDVKVAVVHIGSSQLKTQTGKHLYLPGLYDLLQDVDAARRRRVGTRAKRLLVLISEWGLEHATANQIANALPGDAAKALRKGFGKKSLVLETIDVMKQTCSLDTIRLLPADVGLVVGIESGLVYVRGVQREPQDIDLSCDNFGLHYDFRTAVAK